MANHIHTNGKSTAHCCWKLSVDTLHKEPRKYPHYLSLWPQQECYLNYERILISTDVHYSGSKVIKQPNI